MDNRPHSTAVKTTCPYCGVGCGVLATPRPDGGVAIAGDPDHPANLGRLCSKGSALGETLQLDTRVLEPRVNGAQASWDAATAAVAAAFSRTLSAHGPDSVAFYVSGQLLTEDYYVANKLMKGFIGSSNIDTNSRLCMASSVAGHRRAFGSDTVPGTYADLELADLVVLVGSNLAWCHPVLHQRLAAAKAKRPGMRVVLIDPRRTATAEIADLHLPIRADGDAALFVGLLRQLDVSMALSIDYMCDHTTEYGSAIGAAQTFDVATVSKHTGLAPNAIQTFYDWFRDTEKVVTVYSQGVNQSTRGTDKVNAIINCHLATGRIGRPGMGPFSVTGQPNAMGGREVGGMANMLAAHMDIEDSTSRERVKRFWRAPRMTETAGLKAVDLFDAILEGRIKAVWIIGTNPVVSMPEANRVARALEHCDFVAVSDVSTESDTLAYADVILPAAAWGEKDGTVTNSERRISRQRPFLPAPGGTRPDWRIICDVAAKMGFGEAFAYRSAHDIFIEHAALSALDNGGSRDFDIGALAGISRPEYDTLSPVQWPCPDGDAGTDADKRFFAGGKFYTPTGRARFVPVVPEMPANGRDPACLRLNTGRIRDQWHTMTRTGLTARLTSHISEPFVEMHPEDAAGRGIGDADLAMVRSVHGAVVARCLITERQQQGSVFVPIHWSNANAARSKVGVAVDRATDPFSGQPGLKGSDVVVEPFDAAWYGFAVSRNRPDTRGLDYFALARAQGGWRIELAGRERIDNPDELADALLGLAEKGSRLSYIDSNSESRRFAQFDGSSLAGALFIAREPVKVSRSWATVSLGCENEPAARYRVLAGRPSAERPDPGAIVCSCFNVGVNEISAAVLDGRATTVEAVGEALSAGTNCGSCRAELKHIVDSHACRETA